MLCLYYLYIKEYKLSILFLVLTFLFDCMDGSYTREYKMETYFGDLLDHYTDYIFYMFLYYILIFKISFVNKTYFIIILSILSYTTLLQYGCVEHYNEANVNVNTQISYLLKICPNKNLIKYTKFLGGGVIVVFIALSLLFYVKH